MQVKEIVKNTVGGIFVFAVAGIGIVLTMWICKVLYKFLNYLY